MAETSQKFDDNVVVTPHPGEAARLLKVTSTEVQADRVSAAHLLKEKYNCNVILKGAESIVIDSNTNSSFICKDGNSGMATAGMGDLLTGLIAGLYSQTNSLISQGLQLSCMQELQL